MLNQQFTKYATPVKHNALYIGGNRGILYKTSEKPATNFRRNKKHVITSYSIHYTKLYESGGMAR